MKYFLTLPLIFIIFGCEPDSAPIETFDEITSGSPTPTATPVNIMQPDDIVVINNAADSVILLDSDGNFKAVIIDELTTATLTFPSMGWDKKTNQLLISYDSTLAGLDKIISINPLDLSQTTVYSNPAVLTATGINGIARLLSDELIVVESTATIEKFTENWIRLGAPASSAMVATVVDVVPLDNGDILSCSSNTGAVIGTAAVKIYTSALGSSTITASASYATSQLPAPSLGAAVGSSGCTQDLSTGNIAVGFTGGTDGVRLFSSDLSTLHWNFINTTYLTTPGKPYFRNNGNILIPDIAFNHIVEIDANGIFVGILGGPVLSGPTALLVIPDYL